MSQAELCTNAINRSGSRSFVACILEADERKAAMFVLSEKCRTIRYTMSTVLIMGREKDRYLLPCHCGSLYHSLFTIVIRSVAEILMKHEKEFFRVVNAKVGLRTLIRTGVITEDVRKEIDESNRKDAQEILYDHLKRHANVDSLREFCEVAIDAEGFPNMQAFGEKIKAELSQGGWYS